MGWKTSTIIVNTQPDRHFEEILNDLGLDNLIKIEDEPFEIAMNPPNNRAYIGTYKNNLIISAPDIPPTCLTDNISEAESVLINKFPNAEICTIVLHSTVNLWGYSIVQNGKKIRARAGTGDDGTFLEYGAPLPEEQELLSKSTVDKNGNRIYSLEDFPGEPFTEDQVGEEFVFEITGRYFGVPLDRADDLLFQTILTGYSFSGKSALSPSKSPKGAGTKDEPWWKLW